MNLAEIGYFSKTHGIKGELHLNIQQNFDESLLDAVFIDTILGKEPHFILSTKESKNGIILQLEDVESIEHAKKLIGKKVFVNAELIIETDNESFLGFELIDEKYGSLGLIKELTDNGQQLLATIDFRSKEIILPLVDEFIISIKENEKVINYRAPEGLIDLYL